MAFKANMFSLFFGILKTLQWSWMNDKPVLCLVCCPIVRWGETLCYCVRLCVNQIGRLEITGLKKNVQFDESSDFSYGVYTWLLNELLFSCNSPGVGCCGGGSVKYWLVLLKGYLKTMQLTICWCFYTGFFQHNACILNCFGGRNSQCSSLLKC